MSRERCERLLDREPHRLRRMFFCGCFVTVIGLVTAVGGWLHAGPEWRQGTVRDEGPLRCAEQLASRRESLIEKNKALATIWTRLGRFRQALAEPTDRHFARAR